MNTLKDLYVKKNKNQEAPQRLDAWGTHVNELHKMSSGVAPQGETAGNGALGWLKDSADAGFFSSLGGGARFVGEFSPVGKDALNNFADYADEVAQRNSPQAGQELEGMDYVASAVGNAVGSGAANLLEVAAVAGLGKALGVGALAGTALGAASKLPAIGRAVSAGKALWQSPAGKYLVGNVAGSPFEATSEGGNLISDMRRENEQGTANYTDEEIRDAALRSAGLNTLWLTGANMLEAGTLGKITGALGGDMAKRGAKEIGKRVLLGAGADGVSEGGEELVQNLIGDYSKRGDTSDFNYDEALEAAKMGAIGGAVLGGIGSGLSARFSNQNTQRDTDTKDNTAGGTIEDAVASEDAASTSSNADEREAFINAIAGQESGGNYDAVNARTGASGKYQIMPENWPAWAEEAGIGRDAEMTPENQEIVARYKLGQYYDKYGARGAAMAWYAGEGSLEYGEEALNRKQGNGAEPSINEYADSVLARMGNGFTNGRRITDVDELELIGAQDNVDEAILNATIPQRGYNLDNIDAFAGEDAASLTDQERSIAERRALAEQQALARQAADAEQEQARRDSLMAEIASLGDSNRRGANIPMVAPDADPLASRDFAGRYVGPALNAQNARLGSNVQANKLMKRNYVQNARRTDANYGNVAPNDYNFGGVSGVVPGAQQLSAYQSRTMADARTPREMAQATWQNIYAMQNGNKLPFSEVVAQQAADPNAIDALLAEQQREEFLQRVAQQQVPAAQQQAPVVPQQTQEAQLPPAQVQTVPQNIIANIANAGQENNNGNINTQEQAQEHGAEPAEAGYTEAGQVETQQAATADQNEVNEKTPAELADGYTTESGRPLSEADKDEFILTPDGSRDFGYITDEIADASNGELTAAPIRLQVGNDGKGLIHAKKHEKQARGAGYNSIEDMILDACQSYEEIYKHPASKPRQRSTYVLVKRSNASTNGKNISTPVYFELSSDSNGGYYVVVSAIPKNDRKLLKELKKESLVYSSPAIDTAATSNGSAVPAQRGENVGATEVRMPTSDTQSDPSTNSVAQAGSETQEQPALVKELADNGVAVEALVDTKKKYVELKFRKADSGQETNVAQVLKDAGVRNRLGRAGYKFASKAQVWFAHMDNEEAMQLAKELGLRDNVDAIREAARQAISDAPKGDTNSLFNNATAENESSASTAEQNITDEVSQQPAEVNENLSGNTNSTAEENNATQATPKRFDGARARKTLDALIGRKKSEPQANDVIPKLVNVFNEDELDAEIAKAKAEMNKLSANPMFNPVLMKSLFKIGGIYLQKGVNKFAAWAQNMVDVMGESVRPFLPAVWSSLKKYPQGQKFNDDVMSAVMEYVGDGVDQGKSLSAIKREFVDDYGEDYLGYVDAAYEGVKEYPTEIADNVVKSNTEETAKEAKEDSEIIRRETARADSDVTGARPDTGRSSVSGSVSAPQTQGDAGAGAAERGVSAQVTEKKLAPAQKKAAKAKEVPGHNFTITEEENIGKGGPKAKYKDNVEAIKLLKQLEAENRLATPEEQKVLARYVGWGGLSPVFNTYGRGAEQWKNEQQELQELLTGEEYNAARASTNNAHYTSPEVIKGVWDIVGRLGFKSGRVLEPSMGIGNFYGMMPEAMRSKSALNGVELDSITGRIARQLYQKANVEISGFEQTKYPDNFFDLVVSNVPFGDYKLNDPKYNKYKFNIHNYFFAKAVDQARPGGLVCFITSTGTMQSGANSLRLRQLLQNKVDFIGALRLPNTAFKENAGTDVTTDLIILQKREAGAEAGKNNHQWLDTVDSGVRSKYGDKALGINEYYSQHPEMMLGKLVEDKLYGGRLALDGADVDIAAEMAKRVNSFPENIYKPLTGKRNLDSVESAKAAFLAPAKMRYNAYAEQDGKVYQNVNGKMVELPQAEQKRALDYVALRDVTKEILAAQIDPATKDESLKSLREKLNKVYDAFVAKHGYINDSRNVKALATDPEYGVIAAIEDYKYDKKTKVAEAKKRDIFTKRTVNAIVQVNKADNPADALALSLSNTGAVNVDYMAQLLGKNPQEVVKSLEGLIYENPATRAYETADEYLSGNVREKLEYAREAAKQDKAFEKNVKELEKVQPKDITPEEISVSLGTPWIPAADVEAFAAKLLDMYNPPFSIKFVPQLGSWTVSWNRGWAIDQAKRSTKNTTTWGTQRRDFKDILDDALNQRSPVVYDTDFQGNKTVNQKETTLAQQKIREVQDEFKKWIWSDKERTERLAAYYNRNYNNWRLREYNGSHLTMPGYSAVEAQLYPHQKDAIWRMMQRENTLLAHCVGAGKTWTMQAGAMEMKRLGIIKKPMFVIPNHMLQQFENEFRRIYPNAKLLTISSDTLPDVTIPNAKKLSKTELERRRAAKNAARQSTLGRIATEDWDGIIISHNMFKRIPMSDKAYADFYRDQINEMREAIIALNSDKDQSSNRVVKELEKKAKSLEEKLKQAVNEENKDIVIPFEQLGVDQLFVDEADMFKNLFFVTKMTRIAGLSNTNSQRSTDMFMKTQYLTKTNGGRGVVFATGTPISNTMAEMFTMLRYLDMQGLKEKNMAFFDNWAANFANRETTIERSPDGQGYRQTEKFTSFTNMPELIKMFRKVADVKTQEDLHLDIPKLKNGKPTIVEIEPNDALANYIKNVIADRADKIHNRRVDPAQDNMLKLTGDLRKASLDMRLVDPTVPAQVAEGKLKAVADRTYDKYVETTDVRGAQLIFCDLSTPKAASDKVSESDAETKEAAEDGENVTAYEEIKKMLLKKGIPSKEIAFIHDAKTKEQKEELFAKVRAGDVRVLIGSTEKMGAGTNIQDKLVALHHVDAPWRPRDIEQREGRILRKGNQNKEVEIFNYVTKDSFDANMWEKLKNKASMINQAMSNNLSGRTIEDADANVLTFAEVEALASGNPLMAERTMVSAELNKYETLHAAYTRAQAQAARKAEALPIQIKQAELAIKQGKADIKKRTDITKDNFSITLGKKTYTNRADAKEALERLVGNYKNEMGGVVGKVGGFDLRLQLVKAGQLFNSNDRTYRASEDAVRAELLGENIYNSEPSLQSIEYNAMHGPERIVDAAERNKAGLEKELSTVQNELKKPFEYESKYNELKKRSAEIDKELGIGKDNAPKFSVSDEAIVQRTFAEVEAEAKAAFPNAKNVQYEGNDIIFTMPNGQKIRVSVEDEIIVNDEARRQHNIDADTDAVAEGYWKKLDKAAVDGAIALSKESRKGTAFHEALHAAMDLALTAKEKAALEKHYAKVAEAQGIDLEEAIADGYKEWVLARQNGKGTMLGKLFQKMQDFWHKVKALLTGMADAHEVMRRIESGEAWERDSSKNDSKGKFFSLFSKEEQSRWKEYGRKFKDNVAKALNGEIKSNAVIKVCDTPMILKELGVSNLPIKMRIGLAANTTKAKGEARHAHDLTPEMLEQIPQALNEPVFVMKSATVADDIVVFTDIKDSEGRSVIVPLAIQKNIGRQDVANVIKSIYGRDNEDLFVTKNVLAENVLYANTEKSPAWLREFRLQLPSLVTKQSSSVENSIADELKKSKAGNVTGTSERIRASIAQAISSADTSLNQIPAVFKKIPWKAGTVNIDIGGGRFYKATDFVKEKGVENIVFGPFNRDYEHNSKAFERVKQGGDTVTVANVLNVIAESDARDNVILQAARALKANGTAYFAIYEGSGDGVGKATTKGWQNNKKTADYMSEVKKHFAEVHKSGNVIVAKEPILSEAEKAVWSMDDTFTHIVKYSARAAAKPLTASEKVAKAFTNTERKGTIASIKDYFKSEYKNLYRDWIDKNDSLHGLDDLTQMTGELSVYNRVQNLPATTAGLLSAVCEGDAESINAANQHLQNVKMKHKVTLAMALDKINKSAMDKAHPNYLAESGFNNWVDALGAYLGSRRCLEMSRLAEAEGKTYKFPKGLTAADAQAFVQNAPAEFAEAADIFYKVNDNIITIMEDAGVFSADLAKALRTKYKEYCPLMRDFSDTAAADSFIGGLSTGGRGVGNVSIPLKAINIEGSQRGVLNPLESALKSYAVMINRAERNKVGLMAVKAAKEQGLSEIIEELPPIYKERVEEHIVNGKKEKVKVKYPAAQSADPKNCIFTVLENGKKVAYKTTQDLYSPIVGYNLPAAGLCLNVARTAARMLRTGATMSPSFILRNVMRDTAFAGISSKNGFIPIVDSIRGALALKNDPALIAEFEAAGVTAFNFYGSQAERVKSLDRMAGAGYQGAGGIVKAMLDRLVGLSDFAESSTRMGEFMRARKNGKSIEEAARDAREVTLDFSRSGVRGERVNQAVPFFNACLQGGDKMYRLFRDDFTGTTLKTFMYIVLPSLALYAMNYDEDWYKDLDPDVKNNYWCIGKSVRIPKPQEAGVLFGSGVEALLEQAVGKDDKAVKNWLDAFRSNMTPSVIPTVLLPIIEWNANYSYYKGRAIVGNKYKNLPDELQFNDYTSEMAKDIGSVAGLSPMKIDNLVRGYTGTMGALLWSAPDLVAGESKNRPEKKLSEQIFFRDFAINDSNLNRPVNEFYSLLDSANKQHAGYGVKGKPAAAVKAIRSTGEAISKLRKDINKITENKNLPPERKRELIDKRKHKMTELARRANEKYGKMFAG